MTHTSTTPMPYEAWRITYQSSEAAARAAYARVQELEAQVQALQGDAEQLVNVAERILKNDGHKGSECFDAMELHDARRAGFAAIDAARAAKEPTQ